MVTNEALYEIATPDWCMPVHLVLNKTFEHQTKLVGLAGERLRRGLGHPFKSQGLYFWFAIKFFLVLNYQQFH